jgi:hypothetical protein
MLLDVPKTGHVRLHASKIKGVPIPCGLRPTGNYISSSCIWFLFVGLVRMVAKFQTLMLLIANAESSPIFWSGYFPLYVHKRRKIQGRSLRKDCQMTGALIFKQIVPEWSKISNIVSLEIFIDIHANSKLHDYLHLC